MGDHLRDGRVRDLEVRRDIAAFRIARPRRREAADEFVGDARFTRAFEDQVAWLAVKTSKTAVSQLMRVSWRTVGRVLERVAAEATRQVDLLDGDAKHLKGQIRRQTRGGILRPRTEHLIVAGRDRTTLIDGMHRQLTRVRDAVGEGTDVSGMLCLVDADGLPLLSTITVADVLVAGTRAASKLARRPGTLRPDEVAELGRRVAAAFPPHTTR